MRFRFLQLKSNTVRLNRLISRISRTMAKILVVDDEIGIRELLSDILSD